MNQFLEWLSRLFGSWKFWVIVEPWDIGVRVRLGHIAVALEPGPHFRIPFIDDIIMVSTRLRVMTAPAVTCQVNGGARVRTIKAIVGFRIDDPVRALLRFTRLEEAITALTTAAVADLKTAEDARTELDSMLNNTGIIVEFLRYTEDAHVHTIRLLQGTGDVWASGGSTGYPSQMSGQSTRY